MNLDNIDDEGIDKPSRHHIDMMEVSALALNMI